MEAGVEAAGDCPADSDLAASGQAPQALSSGQLQGFDSGSWGPTRPIVGPLIQPSSLIRLSLTASPECRSRELT